MRFGKEISSQYIYFGLFIFNLTRRDCLTLNPKAQRFFKTSPTSDPTSQKAWCLISPIPAHNRGIYPTVGRFLCSLSLPVPVPCYQSRRHCAIHIAKIPFQRRKQMNVVIWVFLRDINQIFDLMEILRSVDRLLVTDVSGQYIAPFFKVQAVRNAWSMKMASIRFPATPVTNVRWVKFQKNKDVVW